MERVASTYIPFFVPAGAAVRVDTAGMDGAGELKLDIITGGPAFLWFGRIEAAQAVRKTTPASNQNGVEFDMACSAVSDATRCVDAGPSMVTVFASADTIGYLQFTPRQ